LLGFRNNLPIFDPSTTRPNPAGTGFVRDPFTGNRIPSTRLTPFAREILGFYPLPTTQAERGNNFFRSVGDISDNNQMVTRLDHILSNKTSLYFRYYLFDGVDTNRSPIENSGDTNDVRSQNLALSVTHSFSANTLYELRLGYNRPGYFILQDGAYETDFAAKLGIKNLLNDPILRGIPSVGLTTFSGIGVVANPNAQLSNVYQIVNHLSLVRSAHNLKVGADLRKTNYNDRGERNARGAFNFSGAMTADPQRRAITGVSVADLLLGLPLNAQGGLTSLAGNFNAFHYYFFAQDDWKISPRLTLNLGLRYELNTRFVEVQDRQSFFDRAFPGGRLLLAGTSQAFQPPNSIIDAPATPRGLFGIDK
ncbi:MAG: TonB-dependent receptor domain-containing protein, partial [Bryobacteraceae bacterium]